MCRRTNRRFWGNIKTVVFAMVCSSWNAINRNHNTPTEAGKPGCQAVPATPLSYKTPYSCCWHCPISTATTHTGPISTATTHTGPIGTAATHTGPIGTATTHTGSSCASSGGLSRFGLVLVTGLSQWKTVSGSPLRTNHSTVSRCRYCDGEVVRHLTNGHLVLITRLLSMSKNQALLKTFYTIRYTVLKGGYTFAKYSVASPYKKGDGL